MLINPSTDARGAEEVEEGNWRYEYRENACKSKCLFINMYIYSLTKEWKSHD
jgi:hypothetical protein